MPTHDDDRLEDDRAKVAPRPVVSEKASTQRRVPPSFPVPRLTAEIASPLGGSEGDRSSV